VYAACCHVRTALLAARASSRAPLAPSHKQLTSTRPGSPLIPCFTPVPQCSSTALLPCALYEPCSCGDARPLSANAPSSHLAGAAKVAAATPQLPDPYQHNHPHRYPRSFQSLCVWPGHAVIQSHLRPLETGSAPLRIVGPYLHPAPDLTDTMSAATPASPSVVRNQSTRRAQPHASPADRPHRSQSTASRPSNHSHTRQQQGLSNVAARDWEQSNLANEGVRRSESRDRPVPTPTRAESSRRSHARYASDASTASAMPANGVTADGRAGQMQQPNTKRRTTITAPSTGTWTLGKTIGAGSMGKVKLAKHLESGEQVRTVPWQSPTWTVAQH
jgi:hypothetical protein